MADQFFVIERRTKVLCCIQCKHAVWRDEAIKHLRGKKHVVSETRIGEIKAQLSEWQDVANRGDEVTFPTRTRKPIPYLDISRDGIKCQVEGSSCRYICRSVQGMTNHHSKEHRGVLGRQGGRRNRPGASSADDEELRSAIRVVCQRFFPGRTGSRYFEVEEPDEDSQPILPVNQSRLEQAKDSLTRREAIVMDKARTISESERYDANPWLKRTGWAEYLSGIDRQELLNAVQPPIPTKEPVAHAIWCAVDELAVLSQQTASTRVGYFVRMEAVRVECAQTKYEPLKPYMDRKEISRYALPWKKILMFIVRTQQPCTWTIPKYRMDKRENEAFDEVKRTAIRVAMESEEFDWDSDVEIEFNDISDDEERPSTSQDIRVGRQEQGKTTGLVRTVLNFCIALLQRKAKSSDYDSTLICALAVLGVNEEGWKSVFFDEDAGG